MGKTLPIVILLLASQSASQAEEEENQGALEEEFSTLEDADYPDLVAVDEHSELMDELAFLQDAGMVESAARHRQQIGMSPSAITVITREDIEAYGATTITDLLRLVPGMDVVVASPFFTAITARLYWTYENNMYLVLVDGREANVELLGQPPWEIQPISLEDIERIEVIRGPASSLYGANAVAGVISITTRAASEKTSGWMRLASGEAGGFAAGVRASTRLDAWGFSVSGEVDRMGLYADPRTVGKRVWKFRALIERRLSDQTRILVDAGISEGTGPIFTPMGVIDSTYALRTFRLAYKSEDIQGQLFWVHVPANAHLQAPLDFGETTLATLESVEVTAHTVNGEVQWSLPRFWDPLLLILGGESRLSWLGSDGLLDAETYTDITSARYHRQGIDYYEFRAGAFAHGELSPAAWLTVTGSLRLDYNTATGAFISPRLALVFRPASEQFVRLSAARAFRKPCFGETRLHLMASFPESSPITGSSQQVFQEFMTRVMGNSGLTNEDLVSFEAGYLGKFLDQRLSVTLNLYYNLMMNEVLLHPDIILDAQRLPDLEQSSILFINSDRNRMVLGAELGVHFNPSRMLMLVASWAHREVFDGDLSRASDSSPKNLLTLGGRFRTERGLLGSLYAFSRSEFKDRGVQNPGGLLQPMLARDMDNVVLLLGKLGWNMNPEGALSLEAGIKVMLPISPFRAPYFRYREAGGGTTPNGENYGGAELARVVTGYLQGSF